jgi:hypothetical protein
VVKPSPLLQEVAIPFFRNFTCLEGKIRGEVAEATSSCHTGEQFGNSVFVISNETGYLTTVAALRKAPKRKGAFHLGIGGLSNFGLIAARRSEGACIFDIRDENTQMIEIALELLKEDIKPSEFIQKFEKCMKEKGIKANWEESFDVLETQEPWLKNPEEFEWIKTLAREGKIFAVTESLTNPSFFGKLNQDLKGQKLELDTVSLTNVPLLLVSTPLAPMLEESLKVLDVSQPYFIDSIGFRIFEADDLSDSDDPDFTFFGQIPDKDSCPAFLDNALYNCKHVAEALVNARVGFLQMHQEEGVKTKVQAGNYLVQRLSSPGQRSMENFVNKRGKNNFTFPLNQACEVILKGRNPFDFQMESLKKQGLINESEAQTICDILLFPEESLLTPQQQEEIQWLKTSITSQVVEFLKKTTTSPERETQLGNLRELRSGCEMKRWSGQKRIIVTLSYTAMSLSYFLDGERASIPTKRV